MKARLRALRRAVARRRPTGNGIHMIEVRGPEDELKACYVLSEWIRGQLAECTRAGYIDQNGSVTRACPPERRSTAILAGLFAGGKLPGYQWLEVTSETVYTGQSAPVGTEEEAGN